MQLESSTDVAINAFNLTNEVLSLIPGDILCCIDLGVLHLANDQE